MKVTHTPGPWTINPTGRAPIVIFDADPQLPIVDTVHGYNLRVCDANVRLIAASPDLLAELLAAVQHEEDSLHMSEEHIYEARKAWLPRAKAALVKAGQVTGHFK